MIDVDATSATARDVVTTTCPTRPADDVGARTRPEARSSCNAGEPLG